MTDKKLDAAWGVVAACIRKGADPQVIAVIPEKDQTTRELAFQIYERGPVFKVTVERVPEFPHHLEAKP